MKARQVSATEFKARCLRIIKDRTVMILAF